MKKILFLILFALTFAGANAQGTIYGRLKVVSGTALNYIVGGADTLYFGWNDHTFSFFDKDTNKILEFGLSDTAKFHSNLKFSSAYTDGTIYWPNSDNSYIKGNSLYFLHGSEFLQAIPTQLKISASTHNYATLNSYRLLFNKAAGVFIQNDTNGVLMYGTDYAVRDDQGFEYLRHNYGDSSTSIYNKLIIESPNDTMLSVRGGGMNVIDGSVLFSGTTGTTPASGDGTRLMWIPSKAAFRAGEVDGTQWDDSLVEHHSIAMGQGTTASGGYSIAMGERTTASAQASIAMGRGTTASGGYSIAMGRGTTASNVASTAMGLFTTASGMASTAMGWFTTANSYNLFTIGRCNDTTHSTSKDSWVSTDPLFQIGNGSYVEKPYAETRNDAFRILKNGKTFIGDSSSTTDAILVVDPTDSTSTFIGTVSVEKSVKVGNDTEAASAANVGAIRYRSDANNSYCEMVMQTGASSYAWVIIKQNTW